MKRKQKKERSSGSSFWPNSESSKGDEIAGTFQGYESTENGVCIRIDETLVNVSTVLKSYFKKVFHQFKVGKTELRIEWTGLGKKKIKGNYPRLFDVWMNGTQLKQSFDAEKLDAKEVEKFFAKSGKDK